MSTVSLTVGGIQIATQVYLTKSNFISNAGPTPGTCEIAVADESLAQAFTIGDRILLKVDGLNVWAGYLFKVRRVYPFESYSPAHVRQFVLLGTEISILFQKRTVYRLDNPTFDPPDYPPYTQDSTVFADLFSDYLRLSGDNLDVTTHVHNLGPINQDQKGSPIWASQPWGASMRLMANVLSPIWGINADRQLIWADVDVESAPFGISDLPGAGQIGCANLEILFDATEMVNDALAIGAGGGSDQPVYDREIAQGSIDTHGVWQMGTTAYNVYKQATIDKIAKSWVYGSPTSRRGHKDDRVSVNCTVWEPGLRTGVVVDFVSEVWGWEDNIPVRQMRISWPATTVTRYDLVLSHELDFPTSLTDPTRIHVKSQPTRTPTVIIEPGPVGCSDEDCGITDSFDRTVSNGWGTSDAGIDWVLIQGNTGFAPFSVNGTQAIITADAAHTAPTDGDPAIVLPIAVPDPILVTFGMTVTQSAPDSSEPQFYFSYANGSGNLYYIGLDVWIPQNPTVSDPGYVAVSGDAGTSPSGLPDFMAASIPLGVPYRYKVQKLGSEIKAKWWAASDTEPVDWMLASGDPTIPRVVEQVYFFVPNTNTVVTLDDFSIDGLNRCGSVQFDDFNRMVDSGWGATTPSGFPWNLGTTGGGSAMSFNVDGSAGVASLAQGAIGGANVNQYVTEGPWTNPFTMTARVRIVGGAHVGIVDFSVAEGQNQGGHFAEVYIEPQYGDYGLNFDGVGPNGSMVFPDGWYWVKWQWAPGATSTQSMKVWADGTTEPAAWMLTTSAPGAFTPAYFTVWPTINFHSSGGASTVMVDSIEFDYEGKPCYGVPCGPCGDAVDDFERTDPTGWGTATNGDSWVNTGGGGSAYTVEGGRGKVVFDDTQNDEETLAAFVPTLPLDMTFLGVRLTSSIGGIEHNRVAFEFTDWANGLEVDITRPGNIEVLVGSFAQSFDLGVDIGATGVNVRVVSSDGKSDVQVYAWLVGDPMPTSPQITGSGIDGTRALTTLKVFTAAGSFHAQTVTLEIDGIVADANCLGDCQDQIIITDNFSRGDPSTLPLGGTTTTTGDKVWDSSPLAPTFTHLNHAELGGGDFVTWTTGFALGLPPPLALAHEVIQTPWPSIGYNRTVFALNDGLQLTVELSVAGPPTSATNLAIRLFDGVSVVASASASYPFEDSPWSGAMTIRIDATTVAVALERLDTTVLDLAGHLVTTVDAFHWIGQSTTNPFILDNLAISVPGTQSSVMPSTGSSDPVTISGRTCTNFGGGSDTFNVHHEIWTGTVEVSVNGVSQDPSNVTADQSGIVTLSWTTEPGDTVRICYEMRDTNQ